MKKHLFLLLSIAIALAITSCKQKNEPDNNQESVSVTMQDITCTATTAHIVFNLKYTNAHIKDAGLMYGLTSQNTNEWLFATLSSSNLATVQSKISGSYDVSFDLKSLITGSRYGVYAYAITQDDDITMTSEYNFTPSSSSSGGGTTSEDNKPVRVQVTSILETTSIYDFSKSYTKYTNYYYKYVDSKGNVELYVSESMGYMGYKGRASKNTTSYMGNYYVGNLTYVVEEIATGSGKDKWYHYFN